MNIESIADPLHAFVGMHIHCTMRLCPPHDLALLLIIIVIIIMIYSKRSINNSNEKRLRFNAPKGIADALIIIVWFSIPACTISWSEIYYERKKKM